jgi:hypothetical protein
LALFFAQVLRAIDQPRTSRRNYFRREELKLFSAIGSLFPPAASLTEDECGSVKGILLESIFDHHWMGTA